MRATSTAQCPSPIAEGHRCPRPPHPEGGSRALFLQQFEQRFAQAGLAAHPCLTSIDSQLSTREVANRAIRRMRRRRPYP